MEIKKSAFVKSAVFEKNYPEELDCIEFAFVGRSNVGKSSLINSLCNRRNMARTSKTPGRTQLINYFLVNDEYYFVDLPGYGFAKVPHSVKEAWGNTMERYLSSERNKLVFLLLDIRRVPSEEDIDMLKWLDYYEVPFKIVFTKVDKMSNNEKFRQMKKIRKKIEFKNDDVLFYSSLQNKGKEEFLEFLDEELGR